MVDSLLLVSGVFLAMFLRFVHFFGFLTSVKSQIRLVILFTLD